MNKLLVVFSTIFSLLVSACGGLSSPDFFPELQGVTISPKNPSAPITDPAQTVQFTAQGQYSTPPGSDVAFTEGKVSGVVFTVRSANGQPTDLATITEAGALTPKRNGMVIVTATVRGFTDTSQVRIDLPVLQTLEITPAAPAPVALGLSQAFTVRGTYSDAPGVPRAVTDTVTWTSTDTTVATVSPVQGTTTSARTLRIGTTTIRASANDINGTPVPPAEAVLTVEQPELTSIVLTPSNIPVPIGTSVSVRAQGIFTNSTTPQAIGRNVDWTINRVADVNDDPVVATVTPATGVQVQVFGNATGQSTFLRASALNNQGVRVFAQPAPVSVTSAVPAEVLRIEPVDLNVTVGGTQLVQLIGRFSDNSIAAIPNDQVDWTSASPLIAAFQTPATSNLVTGLARGSSLITGALKVDSFPAITVRSAVRTLNVTDNVCVGPIQQSNGGTATGAVTGLCLGCAVTNPENAIDNTPSPTVATLTVPVALAGAAALTATSATTITPLMAQRAGFVINRQNGALLTLALLATVTVETLDEAGVVVESSEGISDPLKLALLGMNLVGDESAAISLPVTQPFRSIRLSLGGTLSVLDGLEVDSACAGIIVPTPAPAPAVPGLP